MAGVAAAAATRATCPRHSSPNSLVVVAPSAVVAPSRDVGGRLAGSMVNVARHCGAAVTVKAAPPDTVVLHSGTLVAGPVVPMPTRAVVASPLVMVQERHEHDSLRSRVGAAGR